MEAIKSLKFMCILLLASLLSACNLPQRTENYNGTAEFIIESCNKKFDAGEYKKISEMIEFCQKPKLVDNYIFHKDGRDVDLFKELIEYRIITTRQWEGGEITLEQASERIKSLEKKQIAIFEKRTKKRMMEAARTAEKAEKQRSAEQKRLAEYYRKNPHEYQKFLQQQRQIEILEQQNQMLAEQQQKLAEKEAKEKRAAEIASIFESLSKIAGSRARASGYQPTVRCNTSYGYGSSSTTCY